MKHIWATRATVSGASPGWWLLLPVVWLTVPLLANVTLPPVDPTLEIETRPLEQLSSMALVLAVTHLSWLLGDSSAWVTTMSPRSPRRERTSRALAITGLGTVLCLATTTLLPEEIPTTHTVLVWSTLFGLGITSSVLMGRPGAAVGPAALIAITALGGAVIWPWNAIYNLESQFPLTALSVTTLVTGLVAYIICDERGSRHSRLGLATSDA